MRTEMKTITTALKPAALAVATTLLITACGSGNTPAAAMKTVKLDFTAQKLDPLGDDFDYEGWIIVDGKPISTGKFDVDTAGVLSPLTSQVAASDADKATKFILTIEPVKNDPPAPAATHIVAGDITQGTTATANLTVSDSAALGSDFTSAAGKFILAAPSSAASDDTQGIWFFTPPSAGGPKASLILPTLPAGWVYEGWVVGASGPRTTGRFIDPAKADLDGAGSTAGTDGCSPSGSACPAFPGQDFITPAVDLTNNYTAVITIEPEPDNSPMPFTMKPLKVAIATATAPTEQTLINDMGASNPVGTMIIQ